MLQPGAEFGNVIVVLQQQDHDTFSRKGHDLIMTHKLGMTEALCGMHFIVRQLDGRDLVLSNPPGNVIEPGMPLLMILVLGLCFNPYPTHFNNCFFCISMVFLCFLPGHANFL